MERQVGVRTSEAVTLQTSVMILATQRDAMETERDALKAKLAATTLVPAAQPRVPQGQQPLIKRPSQFVVPAPPPKVPKLEPQLGSLEQLHVFQRALVGDQKELHRRITSINDRMEPDELLVLLRQAVAWYAKVRDLVGVGDFYGEKYLKPLHLVAFAVAIHKGVQALLTTSRLPQYTHGRLNKGDCVCIYCAGDLGAVYPKGMHYGGVSRKRRRSPRCLPPSPMGHVLCTWAAALEGLYPARDEKKAHTLQSYLRLARVLTGHFWPEYLENPP